MALTWPDKDPDEVLDYMIDWTARLAAGETIASASWSVDSGLTVDSFSHTDTATTIWLSDGTHFKTAVIRCLVVTNQGRTMEERVDMNIRAT
jgi:hypothetical protein